MSAARRVVVGIENDDGSTVIWRLDSNAGSLSVEEGWDVWLLGPRSGKKPEFNLKIHGYGERIDTEGPIDILQLPTGPIFVPEDNDRDLLEGYEP